MENYYNILPLTNYCTVDILGWTIEDKSVSKDDDLTKQYISKLFTSTF